MKPPQATPLSIRKRSNGFALVIALALMSFILLILLSISTLTRVERAAAETQLVRLSARQNALLGIQVALGRLQAQTGPDRRITAPAFIFFEEPTAPEEPGWIGVWHTNPGSDDGDPTTPEPAFGVADQRTWDSLNAAGKLDAARFWLVSGDNPDPASGTPGGIAIRPDGMGGVIRVAFESIAAGGSYAYHIADESLKARINLADPYRNASDTFEAEQAARIAQRFAPEGLLRDAGAVDLPSSEGEWTAIHDLGALSFYGVDPADFVNDFTAVSSSVLADPRRGGLKQDLTAIARLPATALDDEVTVDATALPQKLRDNPFLYTIEDLSTETTNGALPVNPNVGSLNSVIRGPRIEALWDFLNQDRFINSGEMDAHEPATADWLAYLTGGVPQGDATFKEEADFALLGSQAFINGSEREIDFFPPFEAMALGEQLDFGSGTQLYDELVPEKHLLVTSAVTPIMTELIFYVRVSIEGSPGDYQLTLNAHPFIEFSNPHDVAIRTGYETWWPVFLLRLSFDFQLEDGDGVLDTRVWSVENEAGVEPVLDIKGRALGTLMEALAKGGENSTAGANAAVRLVIPSGIHFEPGETKGFVASGTQGANITMVEGENWRSESLQIPVLSYSFSGNEVEYGSRWPAFDPVNQPNRGTGLDDYEQINVRVNALPMTRQGAQFSPLDWNTSGGSQITDKGSFAIRLAYQTFHLPFSRERIGENSAIGSDFDVGDAFAAELPFSQSGGTWENTPPQDAGVIQLRALSAEDFEQGTFSVGGMNEGAATFLGRSNPRAIVMQDSHGFGGARNFEATGWLTGFYRDPFATELSESGWGESNLETRPTVLFHVPQREPLSPGLLRHWNAAYAASDPAYLVGSSRRPFANISRDQTVAFHTADEPYQIDSGNRSDFDFSGQSVPASLRLRRSDFVFDSAYYLNQALWDSWFFSTVPEGSNPFTDPWPNSRMMVLQPEGPDTPGALRDPERAATRLLLQGGFNVNSTSEKAWATVLSARLGLGPDGRDDDPDALFYPRMPGMSAGNDLWSETRSIPFDRIYQSGQESDDTAETLSKRVVREIRERGPFLSLSHFINRLLVDDERGERGTLQAALEASRINDGNQGYDYAPGSLTQGDLLGPLGPLLTARGDTFVIRSVGQDVDPLTGDVQSQAWCEATVQRRPEYIDESDPAEAVREIDGLSDLNQRFGRRYQIVDFRWIDEPETL